jgi:hypothetical protein
LDCALTPLVSLNTIFDEIGRKGYYAVKNELTVGPYINEHAAQYFGLSPAECSKIPSCSSGIFGIDFANLKASQVISDWYQSARDRNAFFSMRPDQNSLSIILYQHGMQEMEPLNIIVEGKIDPKDALFHLDRGFVHKRLAKQ